MIKGSAPKKNDSFGRRVITNNSSGKVIGKSISEAKFFQLLINTVPIWQSTIIWEICAVKSKARKNQMNVKTVFFRELTRTLKKPRRMQPRPIRIPPRTCPIIARVEKTVPPRITPMKVLGNLNEKTLLILRQAKIEIIENRKPESFLSLSGFTSKNKVSLVPIKPSIT